MRALTTCKVSFFFFRRTTIDDRRKVSRDQVRKQYFYLKVHNTLCISRLHNTSRYFLHAALLVFAVNLGFHKNRSMAAPTVATRKSFYVWQHLWWLPQYSPYPVFASQPIVSTYDPQAFLATVEYEVPPTISF